MEDVHPGFYPNNRGLKYSRGQVDRTGQKGAWGASIAATDRGPLTRMSGLTPSWSHASWVPARHSPVCTSSAMRSTLCRRQAFCTCTRFATNPEDGACVPGGGVISGTPLVKFEGVGVRSQSRGTTLTTTRGGGARGRRKS